MIDAIGIYALLEGLCDSAAKNSHVQLKIYEMIRIASTHEVETLYHMKKDRTEIA